MIESPALASQRGSEPLAVGLLWFFLSLLTGIAVLVLSFGTAQIQLRLDITIPLDLAQQEELISTAGFHTAICLLIGFIAAARLYRQGSRTRASGIFLGFLALLPLVYLCICNNFASV